MPWSPITDADLLKTKMAPLMTALRSAALAPGQSDPVAELTADVVARIRNKVATCATNKVDTDSATVPASLRSLACRMIIREAKGRLEMELTQDERDSQSIDERELTAVARCELVVDQPEIPVAPEVQSVQPGPSIKGRRPQFKRWQQSGV